MPVRWSDASRVDQECFKVRRIGNPAWDTWTSTSIQEFMPKWASNHKSSITRVTLVSVMIAQWENECLSLSVLSVVRAMISQWENECLSQTVPSKAGVQSPAQYFKAFFPGWSNTLGEEIGAAKSKQGPLKWCKEYKAIQIFLPSGPPNDEKVTDDTLSPPRCWVTHLCLTTAADFAFFSADCLGF